MNSIKKISALKEDNLIIVAKTFKNKNEYDLTNEQVSYIEKQIANEKKIITINQYTRIVCVVLLDTKKEAPQQKETLRKAGSSLTTVLNEHKKKSAIVSSSLDKKQSLAFIEGMILGNYQFIKHKTHTAKDKNTLETLFVHAEDITDKQLEELSIVTEAVCKARDLVNEPVNYLNATDLAHAFVKMGKEAGFSVEVLNKAKITSLKMGGLLAVNAGSVDAPTFSIMEYKPKGAVNKNPYVLVGKGVVYDTGGLSIKPTAGMDTMKCDMAGAAAVACLMYALAKAKVPVYAIALVPATDNRPGFNAFAPGDIITMHDGSTVEMLNSDAEGRMILADALSYAKKYKPETVFEFSTLTGAAAAAIGAFGIVTMGTASDKVKNKLKESGNNVYERLAEFPFWEEYDDLLKSDIADRKNIGGPVAGAITAGRFLVKYTNYPYVHFDIAAPAFIAAKEGYRSKGGTGVGIRLLFDYFKELTK
ncbi:MAG: leucyl aminopeptidase family protein [Bacteroidetes bacterium]|nr:leucyl aminopeptidase family protein [Bacteroidota bacterium]